MLLSMRKKACDGISSSTPTFDWKGRKGPKRPKGPKIKIQEFPSENSYLRRRTKYAKIIHNLSRLGPFCPLGLSNQK